MRWPGPENRVEQDHARSDDDRRGCKHHRPEPDRLLQEAGVIGRRQEGNLVYCYVSDDSVLRLCDAVCTSLGERLSRDAKVAAELNRGMARRR